MKKKDRWKENKRKNKTRIFIFHRYILIFIIDTCAILQMIETLILMVKNQEIGCPGSSVVERLPLAQVVILGSWDRVPHQEGGSLLLLLPVFLPLSVCLS